MYNILIVEDESQQIQAYQQKLGEEFNIQVVNTTQEAINRLDIFKADLIILDIILPGGKNGFDFLREIKANLKANDIPVIVVTNLGRVEQPVAMELGAVDYITKTDITLDELTARIKALLPPKTS